MDFLQVLQHLLTGQELAVGEVLAIMHECALRIVVCLSALCDPTAGQAAAENEWTVGLG